MSWTPFNQLRLGGPLNQPDMVRQADQTATGETVEQRQVVHQLNHIRPHPAEQQFNNQIQHVLNQGQQQHRLHPIAPGTPPSPQHHLHISSPSYRTPPPNNNRHGQSILISSSTSARQQNNNNSPNHPSPRPRVSRTSHLEPTSSPGFPVNFPIFPVADVSNVPDEQLEMIPQPGSIVMKRYATSVDQRNFLTVYEYMVNNQWVIWDYYTGYVHLTGLWKAVGNSKADIVRLVDNSPDLEPVIRRVRGGFLKIQGTWLPYPIARTLASRTCYHIRFSLVPIFGPQFPETCLQPHEPGFGQLQLNITENTRRRRKRSTVGAIPPSFSTPASSSGSNIITSNPQPSPPSGSMSNPRKRRRSELDQPTVHYPSSITGGGGGGNNASALVLGHRHSKSIGSIDMSNANIVPRLEMNHRDRNNINHQPSSSSWHAIESSSSSSASSDDDDDDYEAHLAKRARRSYSIQPPPMPVKLVFADETELVESPDEFLAVLQATRSLQQLSAGKAGRRWSIDSSNQTAGGSFECGGKFWRWDGGQKLISTGLASPSGSASPSFMNGGNLSHSALLRSLPDRRYSHGDERVRDSRNVMNINGLIS